MARSQTLVTTGHDEIKRWAEERGARPARVKGTGTDSDPGVLRLDFPGYSGEETLEPISWDEFFKKFDENRLALVYQERTASGRKSNFNKIVSRDTVDEYLSKRRARRAASSAREKARASRQSAGTRSQSKRASSGRASARRKAGAGSRSRSAKAAGSRASGSRRSSATARSSTKSRGKVSVMPSRSQSTRSKRTKHRRAA